MCRYNEGLGLGTYVLGAVCGLVFASPNPSQVKRGIELVDNDKGFVHSLSSDVSSCLTPFISTVIIVKYEVIFLSAPLLGR